MYDHTFYKQVQISRSDMRPHKKWAVSLVILHMITSIFLRPLCGYIWVNILTGDGGSRVGEVRAGTTFPMPEHKGKEEGKGWKKGLEGSFQSVFVALFRSTEGAFSMLELTKQQFLG